LVYLLFEKPGGGRLQRNRHAVDYSAKKRGFSALGFDTLVANHPGARRSEQSLVTEAPADIEVGDRVGRY